MLYPGIAMLLLLGVSVILHRVRARLRTPADDRRTDAETLARLDEIAGDDRLARKRAAGRARGPGG